MESSACRRRASDADQAARACSATVKFEPVMVKEEPEWGDEIKYEIEIGPEQIEQQDIAFSRHNVPVIKEESQYKPKPAGGADAAPGRSHGCSGDGPRCGSTAQQYGPRSCFVRLERLPVGDLHRSTPPYVSRDCKLNPSLVPRKLKPVHYGVGKSRPGEEFTSYQPHPGDNLSISQSCLTKHVQKNRNEKPNGSKIYNKQFSQQNKLNRCMREHTAENLYCCDVCSIQCKETSVMRKNLGLHWSGKSFSCDVCNKRFTHRKSVTRHMQIHIGEKPYICDVCDKRFTYKIYLAQHVRTHTGEKPFSCDVCNKRFTNKSSLSEHKRTHTGEKPFSCDVCNKRFTRKNTLAYHVFYTHQSETVQL